MRVFLIGFMGSGKSTVGRKLSSETGLPFIDLDKYIQTKEDRTIDNIFNEKGEDYFRETEHRLLKKIIKKDNIILSCGGGTPCFFNNMSLMNENGITIYLRMPVGALHSRLLNSQNDRPLVKKMYGDELRNYISVTLEEREKYYRMAHHTVEAINLEISSVVKLLG